MLEHYKMPVIFNDLLQEIITIPVTSTSWKVSVLGVILVRIFGIRTTLAPNTDTFYAVLLKKGFTGNIFSNMIWVRMISIFQKIVSFWGQKFINFCK